MYEESDHNDKQIAEWMKGDRYAVAFCKQFFFVCHLWDDFIDKDRSRSQDDINSAFYMMLVDLPNNPFYVKYFATLNPVIQAAIFDWFAANKLEQGTDEHKNISYTLRCSIISVLVSASFCVGGYEWAKEIGADIRAFGQRETLSEYLEDLKCQA